MPAKLMERIHKKLNLTGLTICYGKFCWEFLVEIRYD